MGGVSLPGHGAGLSFAVVAIPSRLHFAFKVPLGRDPATPRQVASQPTLSHFEEIWSLLKRTHKATFHKLSPNHLDRYLQEFAGRHNMRAQDT